MSNFRSLLALPVLFSACLGSVSAHAGSLRLHPDDVRAIVQDAHTERIAGLRNRARFFSKITQHHDYRGEHVVHRDANVTAFLDMSDPKHPRFDKEAEAMDEDEETARIPVAKRAHILVVPNQPREHIGKSVDGVITLADIEATKSVLESAHKVAKELGIVNPRVFVNSSDRLFIGYLHVHIIGERGPNAYPSLAP